MENLKHGQEKIKGDIEELWGSMAKIMEMLQALTSKEDQPHRIVISQINGFTAEPQLVPRVNAIWLEFGLPPNYSTSYENALGIASST